MFNILLKLTPKGLRVRQTTCFSSTVNNKQPLMDGLAAVAQVLNINTESLNSALDISSELAQYSPAQWKNCHKILLDQGFTENDFLPMVTAYPKLLQFKPQQVEKSLNEWRNCQFGEKRLLALLVECPFLLEANGENLKERIPKLVGLSGSKKNVWKLLQTSPNLAVENWSYTEAKINYLVEVMKVDKHEIAKSAVFSKSLEEIKCRHVFLERLGVYHTRNPDADPNKQSENDRLHKITDTTDKHFAMKVAHVTLEEYYVFQELYAREQRNSNRHIDLDYDSD